MVFLVAPFGSLGDETVYTGPFWLDTVKFLGILLGLWAISAVFWFLFFAHRREVASWKEHGHERGSSGGAAQ